MQSIQIEKCSSACGPDECDTFKFMAKKLGIKVLHPGGLKATELLADRCGISKDMTILDAGCGSGSSSVFLARKYGCKVVGIDIDESSLVKAKALARRNRVHNKVTYKLADISELPFQDQTFNGAIFQASLIFSEKSKALKAVNKKICQQGFVGAIELAWKSSPPYDMVLKVKDVLCAAAVNAETHPDWVNLFKETGFDVVNSEFRDLDFNFRGILENEGLFSTLRVALKCAFDSSSRKKTQDVANLFKQTGEYLGYGIYVGRKTKVDRGGTKCQDSRALGNTNYREIQC
jgi:SAM-dependent methyltransferase